MFCQKCGNQIPNDTKFCNSCGAQQIKNQQDTADITAPKAKKNSKMKITGIVLVCLQIFAFLAKPFDEYSEFFNSGTSGYIELLGYCMVGIIGVVLIITANKKANN